MTDFSIALTRLWPHGDEKIPAVAPAFPMKLIDSVHGGPMSNRLGTHDGPTFIGCGFSPPASLTTIYCRDCFVDQLILLPTNITVGARP